MLEASYTPFDWYWKADDGRCFGSARAGSVSEDDAALTAWSASRGHGPTRWPEDDAGAQSDAALDAVLHPLGLAGPGGTAVPASVSSAQAKIQLRRAGLRDKVDAAVQALGGEIMDWFTDARIWERSNPHVAAIGAGLDLKDADIDELFVEASKIAA